MIRTRMISALAAPALLLPLLAPRPAAAATITVATCAAKIESTEQALEKTLLADFAACDAAYRKDQISATPTVFTKSAKACEGKLVKALGLGNGSTMDKSFTALKALVGTKCDDTSLSLLGHLPTAKFGDIWARAIVFTALDKAYNQELAAASDTVLMFQNMACYPGTPGTSPDPSGTPPTVGCLPGHSTTCASCQALTVAPCFQHSCTYLSAGGAGFDLKSDQGLELTGNLIGVASFTMCQFTGETGSPVNPPNEYIVTGGSDAKQTQPILIPGIAYACSRPLADEGYISCGGSDGRVNYTTCEDSNDTESTDNAGCPTGFDTCTHESVDTVNGGNNGGACIYLTKAGVTGGGGDAYVNLTQTLDAPLIATNLGTDGLPCTNDDTEARAAANTIGLTTGTASTQNLNTDAGTMTNGPISGNVFPCGDIQSSNLSGGKIAGAFPAESQATLNDEATTFFIGCQ